MAECLFCAIVAGEIPATTVLETDRILAFRDLNPQAPTHVLVIPRKHIASLNELDDTDAGRSSGHLHVLAKQIAKDRRAHRTAGAPCSTPVSNAGQTVFHIHLHVLGGRSFTWPPG